jgi:threonine dehydrogenase-like Zn-dependent dehydrogenase
MSAIILERPGVVVERAMPTAREPLGPGQVRVNIQRVGLCGTDYHAFHGEQPFFTYPRALGHELGGTVQAVGEGVALPVGAEVAIIPYLPCGHCRACQSGQSNCCRNLSVLGVHQDGGLMTSLVLDQAHVFYDPALDGEHLVAIEPFAIGAHAVARAEITAGTRVAVIGAGPIGIAVMTRLEGLGAKIGLVEASPERVRLAQEHLNQLWVLSAGHPVESVQEFFGPDLAEVVFDATGSPTSMQRSIELAGPGGQVVWVGITPMAVPLSDPLLHQRELTLKASRNATRTDFHTVAAMMRDPGFRLDRWFRRRLPASRAGFLTAMANWEPEVGDVGVKILLERL